MLTQFCTYLPLVAQGSFSPAKRAEGGSVGMAARYYAVTFDIKHTHTTQTSYRSKIIIEFIKI